MIPALSDVTLIFIVLIVLYAIEAIAWVRPGSTAVISVLGRLRNPAKNRKVIGNESGHLALFGPAPIDATFLLEPCPIAISSHGIFAFNPITAIAGDRPQNSELFLSWEQATQLRRVDKELWLNDRMLTRLSSIDSTKRLHGYLHQIGSAESHKRSEAIQAMLHAQFDIAATKQRIAEWTLTTRALGRWATLLAFWIFVIGTLRYNGGLPGFQGPETLWVYLAIFFALWWITNGVIFFTCKRLYPQDRWRRWKALLMSMLSPAVSLRAVDQLSRYLLVWTHPLTVAATFCDQDELQRLTNDVVRDLRHPKLPASPETATEHDEVVNEFLQHMIEAVARFANEMGIAMDDDAGPSHPQNADAISYCPRCLQEFSIIGAQCTPCGDMPAVGYTSLQENGR